MLSDSTLQWVAENGFDPQQLDKPGKHEDTPVVLASRRGEAAIAAELIAAGVNVNHRNMDGTNALWAAVVADSREIADALLAAGVDIDNQNENGATVLMYAASNGKVFWVEYLLERGANTALKSLDDYTALDLANTIEILRLLRKAG
jgi:ankyrin repeat protein